MTMITQMRKSLPVGVLILFSIALQSVSAQAVEASDGAPIILAGDRAYPPWEYLEEGTNETKGWMPQLLQAISREIGRPIEVRLGQWKESQQDVLEGRADALTILSYSEERAKKYDYTLPLFNNEFSFFVLHENHSKIPESHSIEGLNGERIAVTEGGFPRQIIEGRSHAELVFVKDYMEGFDLLTQGEVAVVAADRRVGLYMARKNGLDHIFAEPPFATREASMAVKKGNRELLDLLNLGISRLKSRGEIKRILATEESLMFKEGALAVRQAAQTINWMSMAFLVAMLLAIIVMVGIMLKSRKGSESSTRD